MESLVGGGLMELTRECDNNLQNSLNGIGTIPFRW